VIGFFVMLAILGWNPDAPHRKRADLRGIEAFWHARFAFVTGVSGH
jgi:hypothetical protein